MWVIGISPFDNTVVTFKIPHFWGHKWSNVNIRTLVSRSTSLGQAFIGEVRMTRTSSRRIS